MSTVALFTIAVPVSAVAVWLALRGRFTRLAADTRGIALQTIIIIVVLLAIAGAVAAVLINRAGEETDRLEDETIDLADYKNQRACELAGGAWAASTDQNSDGDTRDEGEGTCG